MQVQPSQTPFAPAATLSAGDAASASSAPVASASGGAAIASFIVARRIPGDIAYARDLQANGLAVGERWGCARIASEGIPSWQCWEADKRAAGRVNQPPRAFAVPWLTGKSMLAAGPDRICAYEKPELTLRCWHPPTQGAASGQELPERDEWLNPNHAPFEDISRPDWAEGAVIGGTFACLKNPTGNAWCVGDNRFGQLGTGATPANPGPHQPPIIPVWPAHSIGLGTWHGCAIAAPHGLGRGSFVSCWGRGDYGQ